MFMSSSSSWERERRVAAEAEAKAEAEARAAAAREAIERPEYERALAAAVAARDGAIPIPAMRLFIRHIVNLACEDPRVAIYWMPPGSRARQLTSGRAYTLQPRAIVTPAIVTIGDVSTALHELGHVRDRELAKRSVCGREIVAWKWAMANSLSWDRTSFEDMRSAISTYRDTEKVDVIGILGIEQFLAEAERFTRMLAPEALEAFEAAEFADRHGTHRCQSGRYCARPEATAAARLDGQFLCRACFKVLDVERCIREQRAWVARSKSNRSGIERTNSR